MSTTLLFVELLIAGIQVLVWSLILILTIFGYEWVLSLPMQNWRDWQLLVSAVLLAFVYVFGILFDRLADLIFSKWERPLAYKIFPEKAPETFAVIRFQIAKENDYLSNQLEYTRSRMRIARASALNFAITTILAVLFVKTRLQVFPDQRKLLIFIALTGIFLTGVAAVTWYNLVRSYFGFIKANEPQQNQQKKANQKPRRPVKKQSLRK